ncbi:MAG: response regulator with CheY-like receiver domain and winged-helix DNA-binding domain [Spirochaetes bacterium]|nr:MAG: response regulator with CheY-like receiver domain and winged-helix DNA-binding domain [Spirochaetota bacterium]
MAVKILVADDEEKITLMVGAYLETHGFLPILAYDGLKALALFKENSPDCLVLDINMPGMNGLDLARAVRKDSSVPILFLSARAEEADKIVGLELGADDYVTKPFSPRELVARIRAILRRGWPKEEEEGSRGALRRGLIELDHKKRSVRVDGMEKNLTTIQFDILWYLMREPGRVYSRLEILEACSGTTFDGYERTIDAHIKNIRKNIGDDSEDPRFIGTVRGVGYRFLEP